MNKIYIENIDLLEVQKIENINLYYSYSNELANVDSALNTETCILHAVPDIYILLSRFKTLNKGFCAAFYLYIPTRLPIMLMHVIS